jgi:hypothetical protein
MNEVRKSIKATLHYCQKTGYPLLLIYGLNHENGKRIKRQINWNSGKINN